MRSLFILLLKYQKMCIVFIFYLLNTCSLKVRKCKQCAYLHLSYFCAHKYSVKGQHCTCEGDTAIRQYKCLPSDVTLGYILYIVN